MGHDQQSENKFAVDVTRCSQPGKVSSSNEVTNLKVVSIRMSNAKSFEVPAWIFLSISIIALLIFIAAVIFIARRKFRHCMMSSRCVKLCLCCPSSPVSQSPPSVIFALRSDNAQTKISNTSSKHAGNDATFIDIITESSFPTPKLNDSIMNNENIVVEQLDETINEEHYMPMDLSIRNAMDVPYDFKDTASLKVLIDDLGKPLPFSEIEKLYSNMVIQLDSGNTDNDVYVDVDQFTEIPLDRCEDENPEQMVENDTTSDSTMEEERASRTLEKVAESLHTSIENFKKWFAVQATPF